MLNVVLDRFCSFLSDERQLKDSTVNSYKSDIEHFLKFYGKNIKFADSAVIRDYINHLQDEGKSAATVSRSVVSLRALYSFLSAFGMIKRNPMKNIDMPKSDRKLPMILDESETERLLNAPDESDLKGVRDKAMLELLYASGIKVSELISLNVSDINLRRGILSCSGSGGTRTIPVGKHAVFAVSAYLKTVRPVMAQGSGEKALFVNCSGKRMSRQGFWKLIKTYKDAAEIDKEITPHMLRHSFAAHLLKNGADADSVSEMMGFSDSSSTLVYKKILENKIFDVYKRAHPRA